MRSVSITVLGAAQPQGSKRIGRHPVTGRPIPLDANPRTRAWRQEVSQEMLRAQTGEPWDCAVTVELRVYVKRPAAHYGTGRNAGTLKATAPPYPGTGIDLDKIARAVGDAGNGILWRDDSRIAAWFVVRLWADPGPERIELTAAPLTDLLSASRCAVVEPTP